MKFARDGRRYRRTWVCLKCMVRSKVECGKCFSCFRTEFKETLFSRIWNRRMK